MFWISTKTRTFRIELCCYKQYWNKNRNMSYQRMHPLVTTAMHFHEIPIFLPLNFANIPSAWRMLQSHITDNYQKSREMNTMFAGCVEPLLMYFYVSRFGMKCYFHFPVFRSLHFTQSRQPWINNKKNRNV